MTGATTAVRAVFAALITTLLAALMHLAAGGGLSAIGLGIVFILVLQASMIAARRRLGHLALTLLLGFGQLLTHAAMGWFHLGPAIGGPGGLPGGGSRADTAGPGKASAHAGHLGHSTGTLDLTGAAGTSTGEVTSPIDVAHGPPGSAGLSHTMVPALGEGAAGDLVMLFAHIVAVVLTAVVLKRGEDIVLSVLQLALGAVTTALHVFGTAARALAELPAGLLGADRPAPSPVSLAVLGPNYRRGPPVRL